MFPKHLDIWEFSEDRHAMLSAELRPGERLSWVGCPHPFRYAAKALPVALTGILLAGFAGFVLAGLFGFQWPTVAQLAHPFAAAVLLLLIAALGMMFWPLWLGFKAGRTFYAITTQRVLIFDGGLFSTVVRSFAPECLSQLRRRQYRDGFGDLLFEASCDQIETTGPADSTAGFYAVAEVQTVENLVRKLINPDPPKQMDLLRPPYRL